MVEQNLERLPLRPITPGERDVLLAIVSGATNREIAMHLVISVKEVERRATNLYWKYDIADGPNKRASLITRVYRLGHVELFDPVSNLQADSACTPTLAIEPIQTCSQAEAMLYPQTVIRDSSAVFADGIPAIGFEEVEHLQKQLIEMRHRSKWLRVALAILFATALSCALVFWILAGPSMWDFVVERDNMLPIRREDIANHEKIINHWNGWCDAWPLRVEHHTFGPKLCFSSHVEFDNFDVSPSWLYYKGALINTTIANANGVSDPSAEKSYQVRDVFGMLFPDAFDPGYWHFSYQCESPTPDPSGEHTRSANAGEYCSTMPSRIEKNEEGFYFLFFEKGARLGKFEDHPFFVYFMSEYADAQSVNLWQFNATTEEWELWVKPKWVSSHSGIEVRSNWKVDYVCP